MIDDGSVIVIIKQLFTIYSSQELITTSSFNEAYTEVEDAVLTLLHLLLLLRLMLLLYIWTFHLLLTRFNPVF